MRISSIVVSRFVARWINTLQKLPQFHQAQVVDVVALILSAIITYAFYESINVLLVSDSKLFFKQRASYYNNSLASLVKESFSRS